LGAVWTFSGGTDNGSGLLANGSGFSNPNAPEGTQAAFVQKYGTLSQTISGFSPGTTYTMSFSAAQRPGPNQHGGQSWAVKIDGTVITNYNPGPGATAYTGYAASFVAISRNHTLTFVGTDLAGGDNTVFIDGVRFSPPIIPPVIQSVGLVAGGIFLTATVQPGLSGVLMTATNLTPPVSWRSVHTNPPNAAGQVVFTNLPATNSQQFYRVATP